MTILLLPIVIFFAIYLAYQKYNNSHFGPVSLLIAVYIISAIASNVAWDLSILPIYHDIDLIAVAYLTALISLSLYSFTGFRDRELKSILIDNVTFFRVFEYCLIVASILAIIFFMPFAVKMLSGDANLNRNEMLYLGVMPGMHEYGKINSLMTIFANLFTLSIIFSHLNLCEPLYSRNNSVFRSALHFFTSTSFVIYMFAYAGRDGVVYWLMSFLFTHVMLKDFLVARARKYILSVFILLSSIFVLIFLIITIDRFSETDLGWHISILGYIGGQFQVFSDYFQSAGNHQWGKLNFPVICDVYNLFTQSDECNSYQSRLDVVDYYLGKGPIPWMFATYIGNWFFDFGIYGTPLVVIAFALLVKIYTRNVSNKKQLRLSELIIFMLVFNVPYWGVFYFRQYVLNYSIIATLLVAIAFGISYNRSTSIVIQRIRL